MVTVRRLLFSRFKSTHLGISLLLTIVSLFAQMTRELALLSSCSFALPTNFIPPSLSALLPFFLLLPSPFSFVFFCISYFLCCWDKGNLRMKRVYFSSQFWGSLSRCGVWWQERETGSPAPFSALSLSQRSHSPGPQLMQPPGLCSEWVLTPQLKQPRQAYRHAKRLVSPVTLARWFSAVLML